MEGKNIPKNQVNSSLNNDNIDVGDNVNLIENLSSSRSTTIKLNIVLIDNAEVHGSERKLSTLELRNKIDQTTNIPHSTNSALHTNCSKCGDPLENLEEFQRRMNGFTGNFLYDLICLKCYDIRQEEIFSNISENENGNANRVPEANSIRKTGLNETFSNHVEDIESDVEFKYYQTDNLSDIEENIIIECKMEEQLIDAEEFEDENQDKQMKYTEEQLQDKYKIINVETDLKTKHQISPVGIIPKKYYCTVCNKVYPTRISLSNHGVYKHNPSKSYKSKRKNRISEQQKSKFVCKECNTCYSSMKALQNHSYYKHTKKVTKNSNDIVVFEESIRETFYDCDICGKEFQRFPMLRQHVIEKHSFDEFEPQMEYLFRCELCQTLYQSYKCLQNHIYYKHVNKRNLRSNKRGSYRQMVRNGSDVLLIVPSEKSIAVLINMVDDDGENDSDSNMGNSDKKFQCPLCNRRFPSPALLRIHLKYVKHLNPSTYYCEICNTNYKSSLTIQAHYYYNHSHQKDIFRIRKKESGINMFNCSSREITKRLEDFDEPESTKINNDSQGEDDNETDHDEDFGSGNKKYYCSYCCRPYKTKQLQLAHEKYKHQGKNVLKVDGNANINSNFFCHKCNKCYSSKKNLQSHNSYKHNAKESTETFKCRVCLDVFDARSKRQNHEKSMHLNMSSMRYSCPRDGCSAEFSNTRNLEAHLYVHDDFTPYVCEHCSKGFVKKQFLLNHLRVHKEEQYKCDQCGKMYRQKMNLVQHQLKHQGFKKVYCCEICDKHYADVRDLQRHLFSHGEHKKEFHCDVCQQRFYLQYDLSKHTRKYHKKKENETILS